MGIIKPNFPVAKWGTEEGRRKLVIWGSILSAVVLVNSQFNWFGVTVDDKVGPVTIGTIIAIFLAYVFILMESRR